MGPFRARRLISRSSSDIAGWPSRRALRSARAEGARINQIVRESLRDAEILEQQGRLSEAMEALGEGLAVDPDNPDAVAKMEGLRTEVVRLQRERTRRDPGNGLRQPRQVPPFSEELRRGLESAAARLSIFARAPKRNSSSIGPGPGSWPRCRPNRTQRPGRRRSPPVLTRPANWNPADDSAEPGSPAPVLAADPENRDALALQRRILAGATGLRGRGLTRSSAGRVSRRVRVRALRTRDLGGQLRPRARPGKPRQLWIRSENPTRRSAAVSSARGPSKTCRRPSALQTSGATVPDGTRAQLVRSPDFRLSGVIIDTLAG